MKRVVIVVLLSVSLPLWAKDLPFQKITIRQRVVVTKSDALRLSQMSVIGGQIASEKYRYLSEEELLAQIQTEVGGSEYSTCVITPKRSVGLKMTIASGYGRDKALGAQTFVFASRERDFAREWMRKAGSVIVIKDPVSSSDQIITVSEAYDTLQIDLMNDEEKTIKQIKITDMDVPDALKIKEYLEKNLSCSPT